MNHSFSISLKKSKRILLSETNLFKKSVQIKRANDMDKIHKATLCYLKNTG